MMQQEETQECAKTIKAEKKPRVECSFIFSNLSLLMPFNRFQNAKNACILTGKNKENILAFQENLDHLLHRKALIIIGIRELL